jgi:hypothetical protein
LFAFFREETSLKRELVYLGEAKTLRKGLLCGERTKSGEDFSRFKSGAAKPPYFM